MSVDEVNLVNAMLAKVNCSKYHLDLHEEHLVASGCQCGCASFDFLSKYSERDRDTGVGVIADFSYKVGEITCGIFLTANSEELIDLEVWSPDSSYVPAELPLAEQISEL